MKILVINGSPRPQGNTVKVANKMLDYLKIYDNALETEYIHLSQVDLQMCKGCYVCLEMGEHLCPIKDQQAAIEEKMHEADALIFLSPVYVANVSGLFKNFLDRFAYICHRPRFHGKKAMVITTTGALMAGIVKVIMKISVETWGFEVTESIGTIVSPGIHERDAKKQWDGIDQMCQKKAKCFYGQITDTRKPVARFNKLYGFTLQTKGFKYGHKEKADYKYWKSKGWLEKDAKFYIDARMNPITVFFAKAMAMFSSSKAPKGVGYYDA